MQTDLMKRVAHIHHALMANSHVSMADAFRNHKFVTESMTAKITQHPMKRTNAVHRIQLAQQIILNVKKQISASNRTGSVMETTIVATIQVRIYFSRNC